MRIQLKRKIDQDLGEWHRWFAWFPVWTEDGAIVWLEWAERRIRYLCRSGDADVEYLTL